MLNEKSFVRNLARKIDTLETREQVARVHDELHNRFRGKTLLECFMPGNTWNTDKINRFLSNHPDAVDFMFSWKWDSDQRTLTTKYPGFYDRHEITAQWTRARFLQRMVNLSDYQCAILNNEGVNMNLLTRLSAEGHQYGSLTYPIKCFLLGNMRDESHLFHGIQSCTGPVRNNFIKSLYQDQISQSHITSMLAYELDESPLFVNTALWVIGH